MKYLSYTKSLGLILIIGATCIVTVQMPSLDKAIQTENDNIITIDYYAMFAGISVLNANHISKKTFGSWKQISQVILALETTALLNCAKRHWIRLLRK